MPKTVVFIGGGAAGAKFLQCAAKLPQATREAMSFILIDAKDYWEIPVSMQRLLVQPEKAKFATVPYTEMIRAVGIGSFVQGVVVNISKDNNEVFLADGTKIHFDFCVIGTGEAYNQHPWMNTTMKSLLDTDTSSPLSSVQNDLSASDRQSYDTFVRISGMDGVDIFVVRDFATKFEKASLFHLACVLGSLQPDSDAVYKLEKESPNVSLFFKKHNTISEDAVAKKDHLLKLLEAELRDSARHWASRGQLREHVSSSGVASRDWRLDQLQYEHDSLAAAKSILVLGGGIPAVEAASDLADRFPGKKITILHRGETILDRLISSRARRNVLYFFEQRNVQLIFNESVAAWRSVGSRFAVLTQRCKQVLEFDKILVCFGGVARTDFLHPNFSSHLDKSTGHVAVDQYLRITDSIYAIGDATTADISRASAAWAQAELALKNIVSSHEGKPLQPYKQVSTAGLITLGISLTLLLVGGWCIWANTLGLKLKEKVEYTAMAEFGQTWGLDTNWNQSFATAASAYITTKNGAESSQNPT